MPAGGNSNGFTPVWKAGDAWIGRGESDGMDAPRRGFGDGGRDQASGSGQGSDGDGDGGGPGGIVLVQAGSGQLR